MLFDRVEAGEAGLRLEPSPDPLWRLVFEDTFEDLAGRVRLDGDRLYLRVTPGMLHEGRLSGPWVHALNLRVRATNAGRKLLRDARPSRRW